MFIGELIDRRKHYNPDLRRVRFDNQELRNQADYRAYPVSRTEAARAIVRGRGLVMAVRVAAGME